MPISVRAILVEQTERTRHSSKADIERFIEESEQQITSLESQIRGLVELRDRERACVDSLRYIISPIRTLPMELLVETFELAIDDETHIQDAHRITQVCSDWRKVAHSTPRLWARPIWVDLSDNDQLYAEGLEAWLKRSAPLPIPVSLMRYGAYIDRRILEDFLGIVPRLRSLSCSDYLPLSLLSRLAECQLDSLEELELGQTDSDPSTSEFPALTMAPRLRKSKLIIQSDKPHILVPWTQLTDLTLNCDSPDLILDIIAHCTTLIHATICTEWQVGPPTAQLSRPPLALSHLRTLSLDLAYHRHIAHFLDALSAPALEELRLSSMKMDWDATMPATPLAGFLTQSPNITRFAIHGSRCFTSQELIVALRHTVRLTHLDLAYLDYHCFNDELIDALYYQDSVAPLVPHLHSLVLGEMDEDGFMTHTLKRMLASRWWTDAEMTSQSVPPAVSRWTRVEFFGFYTDLFLNDIEMLQRQGLPLFMP